MDWTRLAVDAVSFLLSLVLLFSLVALFWYFMYRCFLCRFQFIREILGQDEPRGLKTKAPPKRD